MKPSVTVIIVNWNGGLLLKECLHRLTQQTFEPSRILVMDNASSDGSAVYADNMPRVWLRNIGYNSGFAVANNRGFAECDTDYIALLNPDAFAEPDWLEQLVSAAERNPAVAAFGSRQLVHENPQLLDGVGDVYHISGLVWRNGYLREQTPADLLEREIFSPCAGAVLYRHRVLQEVGGFDEAYFCYVEDVDLGFRLRLAGYSCLYVPGAVVHHVGSATSGGRHSDFSLYHGHRNLVWTFVKNMPMPLLCILLPLHIALNVFTVVYFLWKGKGKPVLQAKFDALKGLPRAWRQRRDIQRQRKASGRAIWQILDKRLLPRRQ